MKTRKLRFFQKFMGFFTNKRAVSVALSTMIITAGVIAAGIGVLYWTYSWGNVADRQYSTSTSNSMSAMGEQLGFEYTTYSSSNLQLKVYLINCGTSNNLNVARVYLWSSTFVPIVVSFTLSPLYYTSTGTQIPPSAGGLGIGQEGFVTLTFTAPGLSVGTYYNLRLVTGRGSNFDEAFST
jgi:hypothetical protein